MPILWRCSAWNRPSDGQQDGGIRPVCCSKSGVCGLNAIILVRNGAGSVSDARLLKNLPTRHLDELRDKVRLAKGRKVQFISRKWICRGGRFADEVADTGSRLSLGWN